jgi:hypothetical protein
VTSADAEWDKDIIRIEYDPKKVTLNDIQAAVKKQGFVSEVVPDGFGKG